MPDPATPVDPHALLTHRDFVRGIARSLLWDEHEADDVVQETWIAALEGGTAPTRSWLGAVSRNIAIKRIRGSRRRKARDAVAARPEGVPSDADVRERERLRKSVVDAVLALEEPYRSTVLLRYFENLPPREAAVRMSVPVETVRTRTRRALVQLRSGLDAQHGEDRGGFCVALAVLAGARRASTAAPASTAVGIGGLVMGTNATAVSLAVLVAGVAAWLLWPTSTLDGPRVLSGSAGTGGEPAQAETPTRVRAGAPSSGSVATDDLPATRDAVVSGRVIDTSGEPVAGIDVLVASTNGDEGPSQGSSGARNPAAVAATRVATDIDGRFEARPGSGSTCRVWLEPISGPALEVSSEHDRQVTPPIEDIELVIERFPTATLSISTVNAADGSRVTQYKTWFGRRRIVQLGPTSATGETEVLVRLDAPTDDVEFTVSAGAASAQSVVSLAAGELIEVRLDLQVDGAVRGCVRDVSGRPVLDAVVFFGEEDVARGDEPFKPFDESRVRDAARTVANGRFELKGQGRWVTIWHPEGGPTTVPRGEALDVLLEPHGIIRGVLLDSEGAPRPFTKLFLDRVREVTTDGDGRFEFAAVEPGERGISLTGGKPKAYVAVRVRTGEVVDVEIRPGIPRVRLEWPGRDDLGRFIVLVPISTVGSLGVGQPSDGAATVPDLIPGRYAVLGMNGAVAQVEVSGATAVAEVGTGSIRVHAAPRTRLWVVPEGAGYLARLMAGRMAGGGVPDSGVQEYSDLALGRYEVGVELDGLRQIVDVRESVIELTIQ